MRPSQEPSVPAQPRAHSPQPLGINAARHSGRDLDLYELFPQAWNASVVGELDRLEAFARFATKRSVARFLVKSEIFKIISGINGSIIECGVFNGAGLFTWAQLCEIYEPVNHSRRIIGFDTFGGFPSTSSRDNLTSYKSKAGDLRGDALDSLMISVKKHNSERTLGHIEKIELVPGDFMNTSGQWLQDNQHALISLLYLDFDLYEPTLEALKQFVPRMPSGAVIAFDELNCPNFPGETLAALEFFDERLPVLHRSSIDPWISWIVL